MKKKILTVLLAMVICITGVLGIGTSVKAEEVGEDIDFSCLLTEETLIGTTGMQTWGIYLVEGNSYISEMGTGKIGVGGDTIAATKCKVSVTTIVERLVDGRWTRVTSFSSTTASGYSAIVSKSLNVGTGYYYRVRSSHYAASDVSSSSTDALWIGN